MNLKPAQEFLTRCFAPEETIALLLRSEATAKVTQRIVTVKQAIAPRYLGWLAYENTNGANIYVAANPLRSGSRKRTKESIASVRHIYIDVDTDGEARIAAIQSSDLVPAPTIILSTSPGKYQALWRVDGFDLVSQEDTAQASRNCFRWRPSLHRLQSCTSSTRFPESQIRSSSPCER